MRAEDRAGQPRQGRTSLLLRANYRTIRITWSRGVSERRSLVIDRSDDEKTLRPRAPRNVVCAADRSIMTFGFSRRSPRTSSRRNASKWPAVPRTLAPRRNPVVVVVVARPERSLRCALRIVRCASTHSSRGTANEIAPRRAAHPVTAPTSCEVAVELFCPRVAADGDRDNADRELYHVANRGVIARLPRESRSPPPSDGGCGRLPRRSVRRANSDRSD